jgi:hypothetical protein
MKRLILLVALVMAMAVLVPAAFADDDVDADADDTEMTENDPSTAQLWKAQMIADYVGYIIAPDASHKFVANEDEVAAVTAIRTGPPTVGWGVLFKLQAYQAAGMDPKKFLMDGDGYALGQIRKLYLEGDYLEMPYKNLGQLQKSYKEKPNKPDKATPPGQLKKADKTDS